VHVYVNARLIISRDVAGDRTARTARRERRKNTQEDTGREITLMLADIHAQSPPKAGISANGQGEQHT
jgi:hypothetical protein